MKKIGEMLTQAFADMKESANAQHEVDKANFEAAKTEAKANYMEAKPASNISVHKEKLQEKREEQLSIAKERIDNANVRINAI